MTYQDAGSVLIPTLTVWYWLTPAKTVAENDVLVLNAKRLWSLMISNTICQIRYPSFVGQDVHIMCINTDTQAALDWMDWQTPDADEKGLLMEFEIPWIS